MRRIHGPIAGTSAGSRAKPLATVLIGLALGVAALTPAGANDGVVLTHVHGLSYSADGARLMIPSHHGLAVYESGRWTRGAGPAHDYMGFAATRDALYSSGHPAPGSGLRNPFGLIKSVDSGKTWRKLGLEGEADFHLLATSYGTNAVYVLTHERNSRMAQAGLYATLDDGLKWTRAAAKGLAKEPKTLAVHPTDASIVAAGTAEGLYLSRDAGASFERLVGDQQVLAATFDLDGRQLWFSAYAGQPALMHIALALGARPVAVPLPAMTDDAPAYIAQSPLQRSEIAIATFKRSVYLSKDQGRNWTQIAREGSTLK